MLGEREVDELVFGGDAGEAFAEISSCEGEAFAVADVDDGFGAGEGVPFCAKGVEKVANNVAGEKDLALGESDVVGIGGVKGVANDGVASVRQVGMLGAHSVEDLLGGATSKDWGATTKMAGEADGVEVAENAVGFAEACVCVEDFGVGEAEIEFAEGVAIVVALVVSVGEGVGWSD